MLLGCIFDFGVESFAGDFIFCDFCFIFQYFADLDLGEESGNSFLHLTRRTELSYGCKLLLARNNTPGLPSGNRWLDHAKLVGHIPLTERVPYTSGPQAQAKEFS